MKRIIEDIVKNAYGHDGTAERLRNIGKCAARKERVRFAIDRKEMNIKRDHSEEKKKIIESLLMRGDIENEVMEKSKHGREE